jgi:predicted esterase
MNTQTDPHANGPIATRGPAPGDAAATIVMVHGRGASAESILALYDEFEINDLAAIAPQAAEGTWYPQSFLAPISANQPMLDSALNRLEAIVSHLIATGVQAPRIALLGFSQGACLTSEFIARYPRRYGAAMVLTGGLIGPPDTPRHYGGSLEGTPIFLGTSDPDPHVPFARVQETADILTSLGGTVDLRRYPGLPHTINSDEIDACRALLSRIVPVNQ